MSGGNDFWRMAVGLFALYGAWRFWNDVMTWAVCDRKSERDRRLDEERRRRSERVRINRLRDEAGKPRYSSPAIIQRWIEENEVAGRPMAAQWWPMKERGLPHPRDQRTALMRLGAWPDLPPDKGGIWDDDIALPDF